MLIDEVQAEYARLYGGVGDIAPIDPAEFVLPEGAFALVYCADVPVAMGGWRAHGDGVAEIKRMYVRPPWRGRGFSDVVLAWIEQSAADAGRRQMILETGEPQPAAVALYRKSGYTNIPAFGFYAGEPQSVHLGKALL
ncbi:GNAT family N-acetyltransferase [soil metagenome]